MKVSIQRIALRDLEPNPYRHIEKYQIDPEKIARLRASYAESGFWDGSIQARPHPKKAGKYQIAFGHHRIAAAKDDRMIEVGVVVANRDNATMLRMMASENAEEFKHSPLVTQETIGAVIEAYGAGEIELEVPTDLRGGSGGVYRSQVQSKPYTLPMVAKFLGWTDKSGQPTRNCRIAFEAWHAQHDYGVDVRKELEKIPVNKRTTLATDAILRAVKAATKGARQLPQAEKQRAAKSAAAAVVQNFKDNIESTRIEDEASRRGQEAARAANVRAGIRTDSKEPPPLPVFVANTTDGIRSRAQSFIAEVQEKVDAILPYKDQLEDSFRNELVKELRKWAKEVALVLNRRADMVEHRHMRTVSPTPRKRISA